MQNNCRKISCEAFQTDTSCALCFLMTIKKDSCHVYLSLPLLGMLRNLIFWVAISNRGSLISDRFNWLKNRSDEYQVIVIEELSSKKIVASGSVFVEKKFIRGCGSVGHIEDIVVDDSQRGKNFGKRYLAP